MRNAVLSALLPLMVLGTSCESVNPEKREATHFVATLTAHSSTLQALDAEEAQLLSRLQSWIGPLSSIGVCDTRFMFGGGNNSERRDASQARSFANEIERLSGQLTGARATFDSLTLQHPSTQVARTSLVQQLRLREQNLAQIQDLLQRTSSEVPRVPNCFGAVPHSASDLSALLRTYPPSNGAVSRTIDELRMQYTISDQEIAEVRSPQQ